MLFFIINIYVIYDNMKHLLCIIFVCLFLIGCSRYIMKNQIHGDFYKYQIDSILNIEKISNDFSKWENASIIDYETNDSIYQYIFIRELNKTEIIYTLIKVDSIYKLNKRIVERVK